MLKKNVISNNEGIYYAPRSEFDDNDDKYKNNNNNNNIETKPPNVFNYLKILSQEAKNLINEIKVQMMISAMVSFFLLVTTEKNFTLTLLINY